MNTVGSLYTKIRTNENKIPLYTTQYMYINIKKERRINASQIFCIKNMTYNRLKFIIMLFHCYNRMFGGKN